MPSISFLKAGLFPCGRSPSPLLIDNASLRSGFDCQVAVKENRNAARIAGVEMTRSIVNQTQVICSGDGF